MVSKSTKLTLAVGTALLASLTLTGCTINIGDTGSTHNGMMHDQGSGDLSGSDIMFAQMMIPHHQQAVDMGTLAETRAFSPEVKTLAAQIKAEQDPEISLMKSWLEAANASLDMGHDMGMGGMLSDSEMTALEQAEGTEFDRLFLEGMIEHHRGAIQMAEMIEDSSNPDVAKLGQAIIESQTKQITYMESLLKK